VEPNRNVWGRVKYWKLTRKDTKPASPEIVLDNPAMDINQGDTNSPNPGSSGLWDV